MKLLVIDGNSIINRAFYGIKLLTTKDGRFTNGIYGFMNILLRLTETEQPDGVAVAFDLHAPTFRHKMYPEYKAGRKGMPPELREQMPVMKNILTLMGYKVLEQEGYEADDIIGTLADACRKRGDLCSIATGDRDAFQLVGGGVKVLLTATKMGHPEMIPYEEEEIAEKYDGLKPSDLIQVKALMGDSSDNIPGVSGIGEKTAVALISRFGTLENLYANIDSDEIKPGVREKLLRDKDNAFLSRELGTICLDAPVSRETDDYLPAERDDAALSAVLCDLEMFKMIERLSLKSVPAPAKADAEKAAFTQTSSINGDAADVYIDGDKAFISSSGQVLVTDTASLAAIIDGKRVRAFDSKALYHICDADVIFDASLAAYLLNPSSSDYTLSRLCAEYGAAADADENILQGAQFSVLCDALEKEIEKQSLGKLLGDIEIPLARVLADMEESGFLVDTEGIRLFGEMLSDSIDKLVKNIYDLVGYEFNLNSPKQLGEALFERLQLPSSKKTKNGYSTSAEVLEKLRDAHPVVGMLLEYRQLAKLKSTYCDGLLKAAGADGRVHSTLNQTETRTGRISSAEPNLQNIPVRSELGAQMRKFFIAPRGRVLCDADYSQIELRVLAHISGDKAMIDAFKNGTDIHTLTASQVFSLPIDMVTPIMRTRAKAVNFGIVYGIGAFSLAKDIGVGYGEAKDYINGYMSTYSGVADYMKNIVEKAKNDGFVETIFGRRRYLPELTSTNGMLRSFGERVARNAPIQGTAADIIKIAMVRVYNRLKAENLDAKLILQIHDELIVEASEDCAEKAALILREEMENACQMAVPLPADVHIGKTWYEAKG